MLALILPSLVIPRRFDTLLHSPSTPDSPSLRIILASEVLIVESLRQLSFLDHELRINMTCIS